MTNADPCAEFKPLLAGLIDKELDAAESATINNHLIRCERCREEYESLLRGIPELNSLSIREPQDDDLEALWSIPYSKAVRNSGLLLLIGGYLAFLIYGLAQFFADDSEGLFGKLGIAAILVGGAITLGVVIIERIHTYKTDPYKEVER